MGHLELGLISIFIVFCGVIHHLVSQNVKDPYIDEIFHLTQCNAYCQYQFDVWDNKITTPPGLYILGFCYGKILELLTSRPIESICLNYDILRSLNLLGGVVVLPAILSSLNSNGQFLNINIISMPLLFAYYFLFYTDVWSLVLIIGSLVCVANPQKTGFLNTALSGFVGFLSLWFRQTNIIWIAFIASIYIDKLSQAYKTSDVVTYTTNYIKNALVNLPFLLPFIVNFVLFGVFLKVNGGITFGDKENHEINLHVVQVFYAFTFINCFTWPVWLSTYKIRKYIKFCVGHQSVLSIITHVVGNVLFAALIKYIIDNFTVVHPFLLADNRHYTFYIWKRILSHSKSHWLMIPIYHFASWNIVDSLLSNKSQLSLSFVTVITFIISIVLTVVPSPLFEPRYYITPLIIFRLFISPTDHPSTRNLVEFIYLNAINVIIMGIFFTYEFTWDSEPGRIQRIIW